MLRRTTLLFFSVITLALSGCGGGDGGSGDRLTKEDYERELASLGPVVSEGFEWVDDPVSPEGFDTQIRRLQAGLNDFADRLNDLNPPEEIQDAHEKLIESMRQLSEDLDQISPSLAEAARSDDPAAAFEILGQLAALESSLMLQEVQVEFEEKGYSAELEDAE